MNIEATGIHRSLRVSGILLALALVVELISLALGKAAGISLICFCRRRAFSCGNFAIPVFAGFHERITRTMEQQTISDTKKEPARGGISSPAPLVAVATRRGWFALAATLPA